MKQNSIEQNRKKIVWEELAPSPSSWKSVGEEIISNLAIVKVLSGYSWAPQLVLKSEMEADSNFEKLNLRTS